MKKGIIALIVLLGLAGGVFWATADDDMRRLALNLPTDSNVLFWSSDQRDAAFRAMDRLPVLSESRVIPAGGDVYPLPEGEPLDVGRGCRCLHDLPARCRAGDCAQRQGTA
ncbi:hypothetical protein ULG90_02000 [Halopseudomonas pachastrellae]|nr:hypothetical protein ULG90_02000 [Halopseudomonas pachastrellae]